MKNFYAILLLIFTFNNLFAQGIDKPQYRITTYRAGVLLGNIDIELFPLIAPNHTRNFDSLATALLFDSTAFHRIVPGSVIQGGDPNSINGPVSTWGNGNVNQQTVNAEFSVARHLRGRIGAARDVNINSANSQFYICVANALSLDGQYTVFGQTIAGTEVVDTIVNSPRDVNDVPLQKITMFVTSLGLNSSIPGSSSLIAPIDQSVNISKTQVFTWTAVPEAVIYTVEFSTDSTFATISDSVQAGTSQATCNSLLASTKYFWRVKNNNGGHESGYSNIYSFSTAYGIPSLLSPLNASVNTSLDPVLTWSSVPVNNVNYELQIGTTPMFSTIIYDQSGLTDTVQQVFGLSPVTNYYWRVNAYDSANTGNFAARFRFTTAPATGLKENKSIISKVYPNPSKDEITIELSEKINNKIVISIYDPQGKLIQRKFKYVFSTDKILKVDVRNIQKGNYILEIINSGKASVNNISIQ